MGLPVRQGCPTGSGDVGALERAGTLSGHDFDGLLLR
jgi:hypothetical protein